MNPLFRQLLCLTGALCAATSLADEAVLSNGDRISGTLLKQNMDEVTIQTSYAGKLKIRRSEITRLSTDHALRIRLHDGREFDGILQEDQPGSMRIETADRQQIPVSGLDAIAAIGATPSSKPADYDWRGNVTLAGETKSGNTDTDKLNIDTRVVTEKKDDKRFTVSAMLAREHADGRLTKEQYQLAGKYDHFFHKNWYGYAIADFEQDPFKDIDLRSTVSVGSGYQFYDTEELRLSLEAGLSYTDTRFEQDEDDRYPGLNWGFDWEQSLLDGRLNFFHRHRGNQGLDSSDNLIIKAKTGLRVPIAAGLSATAEYDLDWDRSPPDNTRSMDHTYLLGAGYDW